MRFRQTVLRRTRRGVTSEHCRRFTALQRLIRNARFSKDLFISRDLGRLFHIDEFHFHFTGAPQQCWAFSSRDAAGSNSSSVRERESLSVVGIKRFDFKRRPVGLREKYYASIGHRTVYVHQQYFNLRRALPSAGGDFAQACQREPPPKLRTESLSGKESCI